MNATMVDEPFELRTEDLAGMALFAEVDVSTIKPLLDHCERRILERNEILITAGEHNHRLYLIVSGRLRVHLHDVDSPSVALLEAGESVGEISIIDRLATSANVVAEERTKVLAIEEDLLWKLVRSSHGVACNLLHILAQRLRHGNTVIHRIQELLHEYEYDATIDPLTGLFNRRWLANMLRRLTQRAATNGQPLSVAMIDIDHFKRFNDEFGHLAGDRALHAVARCLADHLRPEDTITRYGGEELLAILPGSSLDGARVIGERLRRAVHGLRVQLASGAVLPPPTISVGVAELKPPQATDDLIAAADAALYRAKRAGRNRVSA
jgi:diguanylate cyclase (GGDEF)-like protein